MKRIIDWLKSILTRRANSAVDNQVDGNTVDAQSEPEVAAPMDDQEDESAKTVPHLQDLDLDLSDTDK